MYMSEWTIDLGVEVVRHLHHHRRHVHGTAGGEHQRLQLRHLRRVLGGGGTDVNSLARWFVLLGFSGAYLETGDELRRAIERRRGVRVWMSLSGGYRRGVQTLQRPDDGLIFFSLLG